MCFLTCGRWIPCSRIPSPRCREPWSSRQSWGQHPCGARKGKVTFKCWTIDKDNAQITDTALPLQNAGTSNDSVESEFSASFFTYRVTLDPRPSWRAIKMLCHGGFETKPTIDFVNQHGRRITRPCPWKCRHFPTDFWRKINDFLRPWWSCRPVCHRRSCRRKLWWPFWWWMCWIFNDFRVEKFEFLRKFRDRDALFAVPHENRVSKITIF